MFEVIELIPLFGITHCKAKTSSGIIWFFFRGNLICYSKGLVYDRKSRSSHPYSIVGLSEEDWEDFKKVFKNYPLED